MVRPPVSKQLEDVDAVAEKHPELREFLAIHKLVLEFQLAAEKLIDDISRVDLEDAEYFRGLEELAETSKKPITHLLKEDDFDFSPLKGQLKKFLEALLAKNVRFKEDFESFLAKLDGDEIDITRLGAWSLTGKGRELVEYAKSLKVNLQVTLYVADVLAMPVAASIAKVVSEEYLNKPWRGECPVCGRLPMVGRAKGEERYMACGFCGSDYKIGIICPICGNTDSERLKSVGFTGAPGLRIDYCEVCGHYVKIIDEEVASEDIPPGLEDIMTLGLDVIAERLGLLRF